MVKCEECGKEFKSSQGLSGHRQLVHRPSAEPSAERTDGQPGAGDGKRPVAPARRTQPLTPVHAALVQFVSQTFVVPNTPALTYGFLCARKFGFQGDMALFLQEVIDDFYASRHINYYTEVLQWDANGIGSVLKEPVAPLSESRGDGAGSATGTESR